MSIFSKLQGGARDDVAFRSSHLYQHSQSLSYELFRHTSKGDLILASKNICDVRWLQGFDARGSIAGGGGAIGL